MEQFFKIVLVNVCDLRRHVFVFGKELFTHKAEGLVSILMS